MVGIMRYFLALCVAIVCIEGCSEKDRDNASGNATVAQSKAYAEAPVVRDQIPPALAPAPLGKFEEGRARAEKKAEIPAAGEKDEKKNDPKSVVKAYWQAKTWEEKLPFVVDPERVKPLMEAWYREKPR
jgi:hypothetical protein